MYGVVYEPRVQDEQTIAIFSTKEKAEKFLEKIKTQRPKAWKYHSIKTIDDVDDWPWSDSGCENFT